MLEEIRKWEGLLIEAHVDCEDEVGRLETS
jgi:hypothetical protein